MLPQRMSASSLIGQSGQQLCLFCFVFSFVLQLGTNYTYYLPTYVQESIYGGLQVPNSNKRHIKKIFIKQVHVLFSYSLFNCHRQSKHMNIFRGFSELTSSASTPFYNFMEESQEETVKWKVKLIPKVIYKKLSHTNRPTNDRPTDEHKGSQRRYASNNQAQHLTLESMSSQIQTYILTYE